MTMSTTTTKATDAATTTTSTSAPPRYSVRVMDPETPGCPPIYAVDDRQEGRAVKYTRHGWIAEQLCADLNAGACHAPASPYGGSVPEWSPRDGVAEAVAAWEPPSTDDEADMQPAEAGAGDADADDGLQPCPRCGNRRRLTSRGLCPWCDNTQGETPDDDGTIGVMCGILAEIHDGPDGPEASPEPGDGLDLVRGILWLVAAWAVAGLLAGLFMSLAGG